MVRTLGITLTASGLIMALLIPELDLSPGFGRIEMLGLSIAITITGAGLLLTTNREPPWVTRLRQVPSALLLLPIVLSAALGVVSGAALVGTRQLGAQFPYDQTSGTRQILARVVEQAGLFGTGVCRCEPHREDELSLPGGFRTPVSIYDQGGAGLRPGLVIPHGNTWLGRNLSIYRLLASALAEEGFIVLTFDYLKHGRSDNPFRFGPPGVREAFDFPAQTRAAIDFLVNNTQVDPNDVSVFGHSGGADWAEFVGLTSGDVSRVALMVTPPSPPEPETEVIREDPRLSDRWHQTYQFLYGRPVPEWVQWRMTGMSDRDWDGVYALRETPGHKPLLILIGERDQPRDHQFAKDWFGQLAEPKTLLTIERSGHYANTGQALGLVFFDRAVREQLVGELVSWLDSTRPSNSVSAGCTVSESAVPVP
jgi:pimeloyl-ACP methyl ester carboxylesterase